MRSSHETNLELLKMQMKLEMNASLSPDTPGTYLKHAKKAMSISASANEDPQLDLSQKQKIIIGCNSIISRYVYLLAMTNKNRIELNIDSERALTVAHIMMLRDLYAHDQDLTQKLLEEYPHAFTILDAPWCAWTQLLK